jgi:DNA-binding transcriptional MerR regulator
MQIGTLARKIGLSVDAIRFYERSALLPRPPRTQGGFRQYAESDVETLAFIRRVQGLGFKLSEIRGLLNLGETGYNRVPLCASDGKKSSLTYSRNLPTFRNWSASCVWPCAVVTERLPSGPLVVRF